jgi:hypothetical protein
VRQEKNAHREPLSNRGDWAVEPHLKPGVAFSAAPESRVLAPVQRRVQPNLYQSKPIFPEDCMNSFRVLLAIPQYKRVAFVSKAGSWKANSRTTRKLLGDSRVDGRFRKLLRCWWTISNLVGVFKSWSAISKPMGAARVGGQIGKWWAVSKLVMSLNLFADFKGWAIPGLVGASRLGAQILKLVGSLKAGPSSPSRMKPHRDQ